MINADAPSEVDESSATPGALLPSPEDLNAGGEVEDDLTVVPDPDLDEDDEELEDLTVYDDGEDE